MTPVSIYPLKFINEPPAFIEALLPTEFTAEGKASAYSDAHLSPYFAQGKMSDITNANRMAEEENRKQAEESRLQRNSSQGKAEEKIKVMR